MLLVGCPLSGCSLLAVCGRCITRLACVLVNLSNRALQVATFGVVTGWAAPYGRAIGPPSCDLRLAAVPLLSTVVIHSRCRAAVEQYPGITACGSHPSQSSLLHRPRLLVPLTCPKPCPNRRCALAVATLFGQVGPYSLSGGRGAICNLFIPTAAPSAKRPIRLRGA
jgi:hypothetical protein